MNFKRLVGLEKPATIITRRVYYDKPRMPTDKEFNELMNLGLWQQSKRR
ncbi:MAG: hypothetical protein GY861_07820 [bacterium]|nr:hypothetical protein [bacterium]